PAAAGHAGLAGCRNLVELRAFALVTQGEHRPEPCGRAVADERRFACEREPGRERGGVEGGRADVLRLHSHRGAAWRVDARDLDSLGALLREHVPRRGLPLRRGRVRPGWDLLADLWDEAAAARDAAGEVDREAELRETRDDAVPAVPRHVAPAELDDRGAGVRAADVHSTVSHHDGRGLYHLTVSSDVRAVRPLRDRDLERAALMARGYLAEQEDAPRGVAARRARVRGCLNPARGDGDAVLANEPVVVRGRVVHSAALAVVAAREAASVAAEA